MVDRSRKQPWRAKILHGFRILLVIALLLAIPSPRATQIDGTLPPTVEQLRSGGHEVPPDCVVGAQDDSSGLWQLVDSRGELVGWVARTLPAAVDVVGYRGPSEASIVLDPKLVIVSVGLLGSDDTKEHVAAVIEDRNFVQQFRGWLWNEPPSDQRVDAVSGATLTSLALAEGVIKRMGGSRPSLVFPEPLAVDEIQPWYPDAVSVDDSTGRVLDRNQNVIGRVLRTGPYSDELVGYQGPTELLLRLGPDGSIEAIRLRRSFDNEPYVDYVRTEAGFWKLFVGRNIRELAEFNPQEAGVEGVSGATMTSQTVADTLAAAAKGYVAEMTRREQPEPHWMATVRWTGADIATITLLLAAAVFSRVGWFRHPWLRRLWLALVVAVIGLWAGNLMSLALVAGWSAEGIAWRLAPGLAAIAFVAMVLPPITKGNPYCNHLCPHGALQQLIKPSRTSRRRWNVAHTANRWLTRIPGCMLVVAYLSLLLVPKVDLSSWEPFHAYLFQIAPWGALVLAIGSLVLAAMIPMAYCRWGCPTGRLIDYVRLSATSGRIQRSDLVAIGLLVAAVVVR